MKKYTRLHYIFTVWAILLPNRGGSHSYFLPGVNPRTSDLWFNEADHITPAKARAVAEALYEHLVDQANRHPAGLGERLRVATSILASLDDSVFSHPDAPVPPTATRTPLDALFVWAQKIAKEGKLRPLSTAVGTPLDPLFAWVEEVAKEGKCDSPPAATGTPLDALFAWGKEVAEDEKLYSFPTVTGTLLDDLLVWLQKVAKEGKPRPFPPAAVLPIRSGEVTGTFFDWVEATAQKEGILELTASGPLLAPDGTASLDVFKPVEDSELLPVAPGEYVRISARASFESRIYVFWVTPQGHLQGLFPWNPAKNFAVEPGSDAPRREIKIPHDSHWRFDSARGLETLVVCATRARLSDEQLQSLQKKFLTRQGFYPVPQVVEGYYREHFDDLEARPGMMQKLDLTIQPPIPPVAPDPVPRKIPPEVRKRHDRIRAELTGIGLQVADFISFGNRGGK